MTARGAFRKRFFLQTQVAPFVWVYRALYDLATWWVARRLGALGRVRAVYQVGGLLEAPVYGISDLDLHVFIEDEDGFGRDRVVEELHFLKALVPMLDEVRSIGVYDLGAKARWWDGSTEGQLVLGPQRRRRLLAGTDVLAGFEPSAPITARAAVEIARQWKVLARTCLLQDAPDRAWQLTKVLTAVWRVVAWQETGIYPPRARALADLKAAGLLPAEVCMALGAPLHTPPDAVPPAVCFAAFDALVQHWRALAGAPPLTPAPPGPPGPHSHALPAGVPHVIDLDLRLGVPVLDPTAWPRPRLTLPAEDLNPAHWPALVDAVQSHPHLSWRLRAGAVDYPLGPTDGPLYPLGAPSPAETLPARAREIAALLSAGRAQELTAPALLGLLWQALTVHTDGCLVLPADAPLAAPLPSLLEAAQAGTLPHPLPAEAHRAALRALRDLTGVTPAGYDVDAPLEVLRLSVLVCTRDRAHLLPSCLTALTRQTRPADEVVIIDNGSTDNTREVVAAFEGRLPLVYVYHPDPGIPQARNAALRAGTGDILCFTDDDAIPDDTWLAALEATFHRDPGIGLVGGDAVPAAHQGGVTGLFFKQFMGLR